MSATLSRRFGISTLMSLRLFSRALAGNLPGRGGEDLPAQFLLEREGPQHGGRSYDIST